MMTASPLAATDSLSLLVDGDATSCRETARRLRDLGLEVRAAATTLERQRDLLPSTLEGRAGTAYRDRAGRLAEAAAAFAVRCAALGAALGRLAESLERSDRLLAAAREIGAPHGLVQGDDLVRPGSTEFEIPLPGELEAWERASAKAGEARMYERAAQGAWVESLRAYAEPFGSLVTPPPEWELPPRGPVESPEPGERGPTTGGKEPRPPQPPANGGPPHQGGPISSSISSGREPGSSGHAPHHTGEPPGRHGGGEERGQRSRFIETKPVEPVCGEPPGSSQLPPGFWFPPVDPGPIIPTPVVPSPVPVDPVDPIERGPQPIPPVEPPDVGPPDPIERGPRPVPPFEPPVEVAPVIPPDPGGLPPMYPTEGDA